MRAPGEVALMDPARCVCMLSTCYRRKSQGATDGLCSRCRAEYRQMRSLYRADADARLAKR